MWCHVYYYSSFKFRAYWVRNGQVIPFVDYAFLVDSRKASPLVQATTDRAMKLKKELLKPKESINTNEKVIFITVDNID